MGAFLIRKIAKRQLRYRVAFHSCLPSMHARMDAMSCGNPVVFTQYACSSGRNVVWYSIRVYAVCLYVWTQYRVWHSIRVYPACMNVCPDAISCVALDSCLHSTRVRLDAKSQNRVAFHLCLPGMHVRLDAISCGIRFVLTQYACSSGRNILCGIPLVCAQHVCSSGRNIVCGIPFVFTQYTCSSGRNIVWHSIRAYTVRVVVWTQYRVWHSIHFYTVRVFVWTHYHV